MEKSRRKNGEGSIFQVSPNKWVAKICLGTRSDGKPNIKQFSGKSEAIVKAKLKEFKKSRDYAEKHMPSNDTVRSYFTMWLKEYQFSSVSFPLFHTLWYTVMPESIVRAATVKLCLFMCLSKSACAFSIFMIVASSVFGKTIKPEKRGKVQTKSEELAIKTSILLKTNREQVFTACPRSNIKLCEHFDIITKLHYSMFQRAFNSSVSNL